MTDTKIIDGKAFSENLCRNIAAEVSTMKPHGTPGLAVVLVGDDPASAVYVRNKGRQTIAAGMNSFEHRLPASFSENDLIALIGQLNRDDSVHGILVQLPPLRRFPPTKFSQRLILARTSTVSTL